jgi:hypothetical protein
MTAEQFTYWLQGFLEIAEPRGLTSKQRQIIQDHLKLVFDKQTPNRGLEYIPTPTLPYQPYPTPLVPGAPTIICETSNTGHTPTESELDEAINRINQSPVKSPRGRDSGNKRVYC